MSKGTIHIYYELTNGANIFINKHEIIEVAHDMAEHDADEYKRIRSMYTFVYEETFAALKTKNTIGDIDRYATGPYCIACATRLPMFNSQGMCNCTNCNLLWSRDRHGSMIIFTSCYTGYERSKSMHSLNARKELSPFVVCESCANSRMNNAGICYYCGNSKTIPS